MPPITTPALAAQSGITFFAPITKIDKEKKMVYGYATTTATDAEGENITLEAMKAALPGYLEWGNIREMHGLSAVGVTKEHELDDKGVYIGGKIVDPLAWEKVVEGVYKGFSIGGMATERKGATITGLELIEISLVDRPANPECKIDAFKALSFAKLRDKPETIKLEELVLPENTPTIYVSNDEMIAEAKILCSNAGHNPDRYTTDHSKGISKFAWEDYSNQARRLVMLRKAGADITFMELASPDASRKVQKVEEPKPLAKGGDFDEDKHPRDDRGRFGSGGGGGKDEDNGGGGGGGGDDDDDSAQADSAAEEASNRSSEAEGLKDDAENAYQQREAGAAVDAYDQAANHFQEAKEHFQEGNKEHGNAAMDKGHEKMAEGDRHMDAYDEGDDDLEDAAKPNLTKRSKGGYGPRSEAGYADRGFQADGKPRLPLKKAGKLDKGRVLAAALYLTKNSSVYSPEQLKAIKNRIAKAKAKVDPDSPPSKGDDGTTTARPSTEPMEKNMKDFLAQLGAPDTKGGVKKGLCTVAECFYMLRQLNSIHKRLEAEALEEGDESAAPERFKALIGMMSELVKALVEEELGELVATGEDVDVMYFDSTCAPVICYGATPDLLKAHAELITKTIDDRTGDNNFAALAQIAAKIEKASPSPTLKGSDSMQTQDWDGKGDPSQGNIYQWKKKAQSFHDLAIEHGAVCKADNVGEVDKGKKMDKDDDMAEAKKKKAAEDAAAEKAKKADGDKDPDKPSGKEGDADAEAGKDEEDDDAGEAKKKKAAQPITTETLMKSFTDALNGFKETVAALAKPADTTKGRDPDKPAPAAKSVVVDKAQDNPLGGGEGKPVFKMQDGKLIDDKGNPAKPEDVLKAQMAAPNVFRVSGMSKIE
jgi:phage head maturation protease